MSLDTDECPRCDGDGAVGEGRNRCTCPVCRGSGLSGDGERKLRKRFDGARAAAAIGWAMADLAPEVSP